MKKVEVFYSETWKETPMAFWVHKAKDSSLWYNAEEYDPPAPKPDVNGKYKIYQVEIDGFTFVFSSIDQLEECIKILSLKLLPTSIALSEKRRTSRGPNSHWLSRLPAKVKPWSYREKAVKYLEKAKAEILKE